MVTSFWNVTGVSGTLLPRSMWNFRTIKWSKLIICRGLDILQDLAVRPLTALWIDWEAGVAKSRDTVWILIICKQRAHVTQLDCVVHYCIYIIHTYFLELPFQGNWSINSIWWYTYYLIVITEGSTIKAHEWWQNICCYSSVYVSSNYPMILECNCSRNDAAAAIVSLPSIVLINRYQSESMYIFVLI